MIEFPYDESYDPPIPACQVTLTITRTGRSVGPLPAILDTGSDGALVPQHYLEQIGARRVMETGLRSQWGERRVVYLYLVTVQMGELEFLASYVVGDDQSNEIIIGRNLLNQLDLRLNGLQSMAQIASG